MFFFLSSVDFRRLRASDVKARAAKNQAEEEEKPIGTKRKADKSQVDLFEMKFQKEEKNLIEYFRIRNRRNSQHQRRNVCDHRTRIQALVIH